MKRDQKEKMAFAFRRRKMGVPYLEVKYETKHNRERPMNTK